MQMFVLNTYYHITIHYAIESQNNLLTNKYLNVIIPDRDSIWTQNYTLAEITGILKKEFCPGTDGYKNRKRYELVFIWGRTEFPSIYGDSMCNTPEIKTGLNIQGINQKCFRVEVYPDALFL